MIALARVVAERERAGEQARRIALTVLRSEARPWPGTARDARHLGQLAMNLLRLALDALDRIDGPLASEVIAGDEELDAALALKSLERVGDHARNIGRHLQSTGLPDALPPELAMPAASR